MLARTKNWVETENYFETTYQIGRTIFFGDRDEHKLVQIEIKEFLIRVMKNDKNLLHVEIYPTKLLNLTFNSTQQR